MKLRNMHVVKVLNTKSTFVIDKLYNCFSGTEKQAVAYDYAMRLANGLTECGVSTTSLFASA